MQVRGVRGATGVPSNDRAEIARATQQLVALMMKVNGIAKTDIASVILSSTPDLNADFPALALRQLFETDVPLLCCREIDVPGAFQKCIRVLMHWNTEKRQKDIIPVYVKGAQALVKPPPEFDRGELDTWLDERTTLKLHNAMWPGLVGKGDEEGQEPPISLEKMLDLTAAATVNGQRFDGIDYFLFLPHTDPDASDDELKGIADLIAAKDLNVGSLVAPVWPGTVGDSAMGDDEQRKKFLSAVEKACRIARVFNEHGVRKYGVIRIDSAEFGVGKWREDAAQNTKRIAATLKEAAKIAADHGERLAAEGEICWAGMHSWKDMLDLLQEVGMPETLGFQADLAHTYLYLLGYNAPEYALLQEGYTEDEFYAAYEEMTDKLRPWTIDFHVAQNDGQVAGAGSHDKTGKHCPADDPQGKLDIVKCSSYWLKGAAARDIRHICWDGCMFPNAVLEQSATWDTILDTMIKVRDYCTNPEA